MGHIFKVGDKVFDIRWGWGEVVDHLYGDYLIKFHPTNPMLYNEKSIEMVSFTEYTLEGFSQDRPEELPKPGDIVWVRNEFPGNWAIGHFYKKLDDYYYVSDYVGQKEWSKRGLEMTTKNPYANEQ